MTAAWQCDGAAHSRPAACRLPPRSRAAAAGGAGRPGPAAGRAAGRPGRGAHQPPCARPARGGACGAGSSRLCSSARVCWQPCCLHARGAAAARRQARRVTQLPQRATRVFVAVRRCTPPRCVPQVVLDLGRRPEARFQGSTAEYLRDEPVRAPQPGSPGPPMAMRESPPAARMHAQCTCTACTLHTRIAQHTRTQPHTPLAQRRMHRCRAAH